jgi:hypothetical protein
MCYLVALHCLSNFCNNICLCLCIFLQTKYKKIKDRNSLPFMNTWGLCLLLFVFFCFLCCVFCVCVYFFLSSSCILCTQCCQFLWIVSSYLWFVLIHSFQIFTINIKWNYWNSKIFNYLVVSHIQIKMCV